MIIAATTSDRILVVFLVGKQRFALPLETVERAMPMMAITALPKAPDVVLGVINYQGRVIPAINLRRRFRLPDREPALSDRLLLARTQRQTVALLADSVSGVETASPEDWVNASAIVPGAEYLSGVVKRDDGLILIQDLETLLSLDEESALDTALALPGTAT